MNRRKRCRQSHDPRANPAAFMHPRIAFLRRTESQPEVSPIPPSRVRTVSISRLPEFGDRRLKRSRFTRGKKGKRKRRTFRTASSSSRPIFSKDGEFTFPQEISPSNLHSSDVQRRKLHLRRLVVLILLLAVVLVAAIAFWRLYGVVWMLVFLGVLALIVLDVFFRDVIIPKRGSQQHFHRNREFSDSSRFHVRVVEDDTHSMKMFVRSTENRKCSLMEKLVSYSFPPLSPEDRSSTRSSTASSSPEKDGLLMEVRGVGEEDTVVFEEPQILDRSQTMSPEKRDGIEMKVRSTSLDCTVIVEKRSDVK